MIAFSVEQLKILIKVCSKEKQIELVREFRKELKNQAERDAEIKKRYGSATFEKYIRTKDKSPSVIIHRQYAGGKVAKEMDKIKYALCPPKIRTVKSFGQFLKSINCSKGYSPIRDMVIISELLNKYRFYESGVLENIDTYQVKNKVYKYAMDNNIQDVVFVKKFYHNSTITIFAKK